MPTLNRLNLLDKLVYQKTSQSLTNIQRLVLRECLQPAKTTYEEIATKNNYSSSYIQQRVAPDLWCLMSAVIGTKVNKSNCRSVLFGYLDRRTAEAQEAVEHRQAATDPAQQAEPTSLAMQKISKPKRLSALPALRSPVLEFPTESVPIGSPFYVPRDPQELRCYQLIKQPGVLICIKAPRQMGKTSLANRIIAKAEPYASVVLNFQQADRATLHSLDKLLRWICANITHQLELPCAIDDMWNRDVGSKISCTHYLSDYILEKIDTPLILVFEESSELFDCEEVANDFFGMLRTWHDYTKHREPWPKLRLILVQSTEKYAQLAVDYPPLNASFEVILQPFDRSQVDLLALRSGMTLSETHREQLMVLLAGHPYLVRLALYHLASKLISWESLLATASTDEGIFKHHLQRHMQQLQRQPQLCRVLQTVLARSCSVRVSQAEGLKLHSMGLVSLEGNNVRVSCDLYRQYFNERLAVEADVKL